MPRRLAGAYIWRLYIRERVHSWQQKRGLYCMPCLAWSAEAFICYTFRSANVYGCEYGNVYILQEPVREPCNQKEIVVDIFRQFL